MSKTDILIHVVGRDMMDMIDMDMVGKKKEE